MTVPPLKPREPADEPCVERRLGREPDQLSAHRGKSRPSTRIDKGYVFTNDEDTRNANSYTANIDWRYDAQRIISGGSNTYLDMVRVQ